MDNMNIKNLSMVQKELLLAMLEKQLGMRLTDTNKAENPYTVESRRCNQIAQLKRAGKNVIYTELQ